MRPIYVACLSLTLGLGFTPTLTFAKEEPLVEQQPDPDSEIASHVTFIVISPYAQTHVVSHEIGDTNSIIKFINLVFNLPALEDLPDEQNAQQAGKQIYNQDNLGPQDDPKNPASGDLTSAFSISRLKGHDVLPPSYVTISETDIKTFPQWGTNPLNSTHMHITPTDSKRTNNIPSDFNPRPSSQPNYPN